jgi:hypothetical protein
MNGAWVNEKFFKKLGGMARTEETILESYFVNWRILKLDPGVMRRYEDAS